MNLYRGKYQDSQGSVLAGDDRLAVAYDVKRYADTSVSFDSSYVDHCICCLERRGYMSEDHYNKLVKIYYDYWIDRKIQNDT